MKNLLCLFFTLSLTFGFAEETRYAVKDIPAELKIGVHAVIRNDEMVYTIISQGKAKLHASYAVTILNSNGQDYAEKSIGYDKFSRITLFRGSIYDAEGNLIKKLKTSVISDQSAFDGYSLYSDNRYQSADLSYNVFPYTVEFEYEIEYKYLYAIPGSILIPEEKVSVQRFSYQLIFPAGIAPRYKTLNTDIKPIHSVLKNGAESLLWLSKNLSPVKIEPMGPSGQMQLPQLLVAPGLFEYDGYAGDMSTWVSYNKWFLQLNRGRDILPQETKARVKELTSHLGTVEQKARVLYEYLQNKTRYVNISLGIGGLQPFEAAVVDKTGYGDCKALSNYMLSMLKEVGITGYYALIKAGDFKHETMLDFPSHQVNHVLVAIPNNADTLWLECTSQTNPFGYAGMFTGDRKAFLVSENGGVWVNTPRYTENQNTEIRVAEVHIKPSGDAVAKVKTTYSGLQYEQDNLNNVLEYGPDEQKKWIQKNTAIPSFDVSSFIMTGTKEKIPVVSVDMHLALKKYASVSGSRLFLTLNLMNRSTTIPEKIEDRKSSVIRRISFTDIDTIRYHMPEGYTAEFLPSTVRLRSRFGEYQSSVSTDRGDILYVRQIKLLKGEFPPESYSELIDFLKGVTRADQQKLVLMNKT
jgi:hypothetical protein